MVGVAIMQPCSVAVVGGCTALFMVGAILAYDPSRGFLSLDDAQKAISEIVTGTESERQKKAKLIFAGLFKTLNDERSDVMRGRYARKQKEFSDQIRSTILQLRELQDRPDADQGRIDELTNRMEWDTRIFEERRKTVNFVCEVPVLIEQRLFALARAIQQSLE